MQMVGQSSWESSSHPHTNHKRIWQCLGFQHVDLWWIQKRPPRKNTSPKQRFQTSSFHFALWMTCNLFNKHLGFEGKKLFQKLPLSCVYCFHIIFSQVIFFFYLLQCFLGTFQSSRNAIFEALPNGEQKKQMLESVVAQQLIAALGGVYRACEILVFEVLPDFDGFSDVNMIWAKCIEQ